jgi:hypothetical protein
MQGRHAPSVLVWDVAEGSLISELKGHTGAVTAVAMTPSLRFVASVGATPDDTLSLWEWRTASLVATNRIKSKVCGISFSADGAHLVTVGVRHVKYWRIDATLGGGGKVSEKYAQFISAAVFLMEGRIYQFIWMKGRIYQFYLNGGSYLSVLF